ncbi:DUF6478 family protein [Paracoccus aerodenitrificans]|uniref:DUF6478 family protein n=1 Tax=Paracoccus aerodenitrificans TaxID=3017781 RepID=UPI0022F13E16|nr:DUF6478 family protein [Paracoccus aerodenitrificans]WBU62990.1 DUF6478 family protein [Paracoccus aerodenitrificans]
MATRAKIWLHRAMRRRVQKQWSSLSASVSGMAPNRLRELSDEAATLRRDLDRFIQQSSHRVLASRADIYSLQLPLGSDWRWRPGLLSRRAVPSGLALPEPGARLGEDATIWHDCEERALTLRQIQNVHTTDLASYAIRIEVLGFTGSFLSLAIDLPDEALNGLTRNHILRLDTAIEIERDMDIYARMNIGNGPNTEELVRHLGELRAGPVNSHVIEFDLALTEMNERRLDRIWLDLIFEKPVMNAINLREIVLSRRSRANL